MVFKSKVSITWIIYGPYEDPGVSPRSESVVQKFIPGSKGGMRLVGSHNTVSPLFDDPIQSDLFYSDRTHSLSFH